LAACDEIEAAYIRLKAQFQSERAALWRIDRLFSEAKSILLNDAGCGSARSSISSLKWRAEGYFANGWQADTPLPRFRLLNWSVVSGDPVLISSLE
jgi:hypothetical protein